MNVEETGITGVGREEERPMEKVIDCERVKNVDQFKILGGIFTKNLGSIREI